MGNLRSRFARVASLVTQPSGISACGDSPRPWAVLLGVKNQATWSASRSLVDLIYAAALFGSGSSLGSNLSGPGRKIKLESCWAIGSIKRSQLSPLGSLAPGALATLPGCYSASWFQPLLHRRYSFKKSCSRRSLVFTGDRFAVSGCWCCDDSLHLYWLEGTF